jgi:hypothetical protein
MAKLPVIFIFDLDGTLICNANPLENYLNFVQFLNDAAISKKLDVDSIPSGSIRTRPLSEIVPTEFYRCGLADALQSIEKLFPTAEFFVFSMAKKDYVERMVKIMEKRLGISIHRPLFTRDDCSRIETNNYKKSIQTVLPRIIASLQTKYPALKHEQNCELLLEQNILFLDNSDVVWDLKDKWISCPDYTYTQVLDITVNIPRKLLRDPIVQQYISTYDAGFAEPPENVTEDERNLMYHSYMANQYQNAFAQNQEALKDDFFPRFVKALRSVSRLKKPFTKTTLERIRRMMES